jgi:hypothetical protein
LEKKNISINRLKRLFFIKTEKTKAIVLVKESESAKEEKTAAFGEESDQSPLSPLSPPTENKKKKGHGKNGASAYKGLEQKKISHGDLHVGSLCPGCGKGGRASYLN